MTMGCLVRLNNCSVRFLRVLEMGFEILVLSLGGH